MRPRAELAGTTSGRWSIISFAGVVGRKGGFWFCRCQCGVKRKVSHSALANGGSLSCGCLTRETNARLVGQRATKHGQYKSTEYQIWEGIVQRCCNMKSREYRHYGGRGIRMCARWRADFATFLSDVGKRPGMEFTLDRFPNNSGDYEPGNVRWATQSQQMRNTRRNHVITAAGRSACVVEWSEITGLTVGAINRRIRGGMTEEQAVLTPRMQ